MVCFTPKDYAPRNGVSMTSEDLRDMPIILRTGNFDKESDSILSAAGIPFDSVFRIDNDESCYEYIRQGFGFRITASITYPPDSCIQCLSNRKRTYPNHRTSYRFSAVHLAYGKPFS